jgi:hypothetical protein
MNLQSGESVTVDILATARKLFWGVVAQIGQLIALVFVAAIAPIVLAVLPQVLILRNPSGDFEWLAQLFFWASPFAVALWMAFLCHWHSIRLWRHMGKDMSEWRDAHGGSISTNLKSTGFMVLGFFGSFACELLFMAAFKRFLDDDVPRLLGLDLWFALFPFAAFAPVILLLIKRRNYSEVPPDMENWSEGRRLRSPHLYYTPDERRLMLAKERAAMGRASREDLNLLAAEQAEERRRAQAREEAAHPPATPEETETNSSKHKPALSLKLNAIKEDCQLIGVDEYYTLDELNAARRTKAAQWHPDKLGEMAPELKEFATDHLTCLNLAYERLEKHVKWDTEHKTIAAECEDIRLKNMMQLPDAIDSGDALRIENAIERFDDGIRRMRACLIRVQKETPTMDVTVIEQVIAKSIATSRRVKSNLLYVQAGSH